MKDSKKALLIGLGATAAIAAIAAALAYEEEAVDKIGSYLNRQRMKNFVRCFNKEMEVQAATQLCFTIREHRIYNVSNEQNGRFS